MSRTRRQVLLALIVCVVIAAGCTSKPALPDGFPKDFPLPQGRAITLNGPATAGEVEYAIEAYDGTVQVEQFYKDKLAGTAWRSVDGRPDLFARSSEADYAMLTNGTQTIRILVTDLGNTTKVIFSTKKP